VLTIDDLPDDVLLEIFDLYVVRYRDLKFIEAVVGYQDTKRKIESWQSLVHVCRRWRCLVFGSPRRLNLQLYYIPLTCARKSKSLDVWPALPLLIFGASGVYHASVANVISVLERSDRICQMQVDLDCDLDFCTTWEIENLWTAMQVPFPELALLYLQGFSNMPVLPDSFLDGSAPRLRYFFLRGIPFPGLPTLTSSNFGFYVFPIPGIFHPQFCNTYQTDGRVLVY